jgi:hypothetical protein
MEIKNRGYVVPVAIGTLVLASLGLMIFSWLGGQKKIDDAKVVPNATTTISDDLDRKASATDDVTLDDDSAIIDAQIKALDDSAADINSSLNDTSSI